MNRVLGVLLLMAGASAAAVEPAAAWDGILSGGIVLPEGTSKDRLNNGWNVQTATSHAVAKSAALVFEGMYAHHGVADPTLRALNTPEGSTRILSGTVSLMVGPGSTGSGPYVVGGGGIYNRKIEFDRPVAVDTTVPVDPWLGVAVPIVIPAGGTIGSFSTTKPGASAGVGISLGKTSRVFLEARYHWLFTDGQTTTFVPINFGFRW